MRYLRRFCLAMLIGALCVGSARAEMATVRFASPAKMQCEGGEGVLSFDLRGFDTDLVWRADLRLARTKAIGGQDDAVLVDVEVHSLSAMSPFTSGKPTVKADAKPLALRGPWFDRLDVTDAVRGWTAIDSAPRPALQFFVKTCPLWKPEAAALEITYDGKAPNAAKQATGLKVLHRAGQSFIVFNEIDDRSADANPTWGELRAKLEKMDADKAVRYLVFRHDKPIDAATVAQAELLGEVEPMSAYNARGRSIDELITTVRRQAIDDPELAKSLARSGYFSRYNANSPEMDQVRIDRFAIEDGKPLPPKTGLFVHHPEKPGKSYYAVVASVDGVANCRDFAPANSLAVPVEEQVGPGAPVLQGEAQVVVFFDYPGKRYRYVQWAAPPLANLPNQYFNWGVFVPRDYGKDNAPRRLTVFFHDFDQRYLKMPWPHRQDTVIIAPHDAPFASFGYGHHESLGTLRSMKQGVIRPFLARRVDAALEWAIAKFNADPARISCGGDGYLGGTAALQYGLRRPGNIAYIMADGSPDPDPGQTPDEYSVYGREGEKPRATPRLAIDAVWGKRAWDLKAESGRSIWEEANLVALVKAAKKPLPYLSLGAGSMSVTWKQETELMLAFKQSRNAFMSQFYWGGSAFVPIPRDEFEPRSDRPLLACWPKGYSPTPAFFDKYFVTGTRGYSSGGRLCDRIRWNSDDAVDTADRLELTIWSDHGIVYAGSVAAETTVRNAAKFKPAPGEKLAWSAGSEKGEITVGDDGLIIIPSVTFGATTKLIITRTKGQ